MRVWIHVLVRVCPCVYRHMSVWVRACVCGCVCVVHVLVGAGARVCMWVRVWV